MLSFSVWMLWSVVAANLDKAGFQFSKDQLFFLTALPALSGATLRIFIRFWCRCSVPPLDNDFYRQPADSGYWYGYGTERPDHQLPTLLVLALLCGLGGGNFSSSMANISFFPESPQRLRDGDECRYR
jgi:NNP family nitrate/nitrite transporter-like MFS transporter